MNIEKNKTKILIIFLTLILIFIGISIYSNLENTREKQILKKLEKQELIFDSMTALQIIEKDENRKEYIYKDVQYYYFFNLIQKENKDYDIYIYVEENNGTPIMPTYLEYTDKDSHYIYLTAKNKPILMFPNYTVALEKMQSKK